jgi:hypothetical protein
MVSLRRLNCAVGRRVLKLWTRSDTLLARFLSRALSIEQELSALLREAPEEPFDFDWKGTLIRVYVIN